MSDKNNKDAKILATIFSLFCIGGGAYGLSNGDMGYGLIVLGCLILAYIAITGRV